MNETVHCVSGSYTIIPPPLPKAVDKGVAEFFEFLGYTVQCDSSRRSGEAWYDIIDKEENLVVQIDQGVSLNDIVMDICQLHQGKDGISKTDYKITGPQTPELELLFKRVYDWKTYGIDSNGQITFPI